MRKQDQKGHNPPTRYSKPGNLLLQEVHKIVLQKNWTRSTLFKYTLRWWPWFHFDVIAWSLNIHWGIKFIPGDSNLRFISSRLLLLSLIPGMAAVMETIPIPTEQECGSLCLKDNRREWVCNWGVWPVLWWVVILDYKKWNIYLHHVNLWNA